MPSPQAFAPNGANNSMIPDKPRDFYNYPITFGTMAPGAVLAGNIQISAASDFYLTAITQLTTVSGDTAVPLDGSLYEPLVTILITDSGSGRQLMQSAVPLPSITGDGRWPHRLLMPRLFQRNSNIQIVLTSVDATNTYSSIMLNFEGFVIYT